MNRRQIRAQWRSDMQTPPARSPQAIRVRIGELYLAGFSGVSARQISDSVNHRLSGLLRDGGVPGSWLMHNSEQPLLGTVPLSPRTKSPAIGAAVAKAVYDAREGGKRR